MKKTILNNYSLSCTCYSPYSVPLVHYIGGITLENNTLNIFYLQLYQATGNELCITAVNVNMIRVEYFHQKTTPDVPVKLALRMSISIPGKEYMPQYLTQYPNPDPYVCGLRTRPQGQQILANSMPFEYFFQREFDGTNKNFHILNDFAWVIYAKRVKMHLSGH